MPLRTALDGSRKRDSFICHDAPIWLKSSAAPKNTPRVVAPFIKAPDLIPNIQEI